MGNRKRSNGDGGLTEVRPGVFRMRIWVRNPPSGERRQVSRTVRAKNRTAALDELRRLWLTVGVSGPERPFASVLGDWLANMEREGRVARSTIDRYRSIVEHHLVPALGALEVRQVTGRVLDAFYSTLDLEPSTVRTIHATAMAALHQALDWDLIDKLPRARPPRVPEKDPPVPSPTEVQALIDRAVATNRHTLALCIRLGAVSGARVGELCGLRVEDFCSAERTLRIERQVLVSQREVLVAPPKRGKKRTVALPKDCVRAVGDYLAFQSERFGATHGPWLLSDDGGPTHLLPQAVGGMVKRLGMSLGISVTPHALRRFHDSYLLAQGVDPVTVAARAGHTPEVMYAHYAFPMQAPARAAGDSFEGMLA